MATKMTFPEVHEEVIRRKGEEVITALIGAEKDGTCTAFFSYEATDDRFIFGVKKGLSQEAAEAYVARERDRK